MKWIASFAAVTVCLILGICPPARAEGFSVNRLYDLSDFSGAIPYDDVILHVDREHDEVYTTTGSTVRVFNASGMEVFRFGDDWDLGMIYGLAVHPDGDILLLAHRMQSTDEETGWRIVRCDYRGVPRGLVKVDLPEELADFSPDRMLYGNGRLHLVSTTGLEAVVLDIYGRYLRSWDLAELLGIEDPATQNIFGVGLDRSGSLLLTIPVLFKAYIVAPDGSVRFFGAAGSAPGLFGIASGIAADDYGNLLVADRLRNVVMVFDPSLSFVLEFGLERGNLALVRPTELTVGNRGRLYVTQARKQGVAVFGLRPAGAAPAAESEPRWEGGGLDGTVVESTPADRETPGALLRSSIDERISLTREEETK